MSEKTLTARGIVFTGWLEVNSTCPCKQFEENRVSFKLIPFFQFRSLKGKISASCPYVYGIVVIEIKRFFSFFFGNCRNKLNLPLKSIYFSSFPILETKTFRLLAKQISGGLYKTAFYFSVEFMFLKFFHLRKDTKFFLSFSEMDRTKLGVPSKKLSSACSPKLFSTFPQEFFVKVFFT